MKNVTFGQSDKLTVKGQNVIAVTLAAYIKHDAVNTAFAGQPMDWSKVQINLNLKRKGRGTPVVIYNGPVLPWMLASEFFSAGFEQNHGAASAAFQVLKAHGAADKAEILVTGKLLLHDIINLKGDDELVIEVFPQSEAVSDATVDLATSYVAFDVEEGVGNALSIPVIKVESIKPAEENPIVHLGDGVVEAFFINNDKTGILTANQVMTSVNISSDKLSRRDIAFEIIGKRIRQFTSVALANARNQCFRIFAVNEEKFTGEDVRLNDVKLDINTTAGNVNAGKNWVLSRYFVNDVVTLKQGISRAKKHRSVNEAQYV